MRRWFQFGLRNVLTVMAVGALGSAENKAMRNILPDDSVTYRAPDERLVVNDPTPEQLEGILRTSPHSYWQQGGNGEAALDAGPDGASLWIKQPEPGRFFITYAKPPANWLVPHNGELCVELITDERGGDPFLIPRACLIDVDQAVEAVRYFLSARCPSPALRWSYWHELPLSGEAIRLMREPYD